MADGFDLAPYAGRTVDLAVGPGPAPGGPPGPLAFALAGPDGHGQAVTGPQKLVGRVVVTLFTPAGGQRYRPDRGTGFVADAARWRTPADVRLSFASARADLARQLRAAEADADPADERYGGLDLVDVSVAAGRVALTLELTTAAGSPVAFVLPVPVTPR